MLPRVSRALAQISYGECCS